MTSKEIKALDAACVVQSYGRFDLALDHGRGATLYSPEGREYIDFSSGIGVSSLGCAHPKWVEAVCAQVSRLGHVSNLYYTEPYAILAQLLSNRTGLRRVFFANSGGEANEGMIKCARKYSFDKYGPDRSTIVTLRQSFHGRTITTLAATGQEVFHNYFFPFTQGFRYARPNDLGDLTDQLGNDACALMLELVQGEGGVLPLDREYVQAAADLCRQRDLLLLVDEVQTGVGRTGSLFAFQQYGISPDIVSFAKGIAGGLPMGGFLTGPKTAEVLTPGTHATTFGGNPIAAAGARVVLETLNEDFLLSVSEKGRYLRETILSWRLPAVREVRGLGLMVGVCLSNAAPKAAVTGCLDRGLLALTAGTDTVRLLPPLVITYEEMDKGLGILRSVLEELS